MALTINITGSYPDGASETLTAATPSTVTIGTGSAPCRVDFLNRGVSNTMWTRHDGSAAAAAAAHNVAIPPGGSIDWSIPADSTVTFSVVCAGAEGYSVCVIPMPSW